MTEIREITFGSPEHEQGILLRNRILREPLGLVFGKEELEKERGEFHLAAFLNGQIAGILLLRPVSDTEVKMRQVATDSRLQRQGIGSKLVAFSEKFAREKGFNTISLHARETAVPFYKKLNYEIVGERFTEVGIPHFKMKKNI